MSAPEKPSREQLVVARRAQILDAATAVFAEKGYHRATTREIARRAGVAEGTIYNYFESKADLLIGMITRLAELEQLDVELSQAFQGSVRDFVSAIFRHRIRLIERNLEVLQAIVPEMVANPSLRERFQREFIQYTSASLEQYLRAQIELGRVRRVNVAFTVRAVQALFLGMVILRLLGGEPLPAAWGELPDLLTGLVMDGLQPDDGSQE